MRTLKTIMLLNVVMCWGQVKTPLQDISPKASSLMISGVLSLVDNPMSSIRSYQVMGQFNNVSDKDIVLIVAHFASDPPEGPGLDFIYNEDHLFDKLLEKKSSNNFQSDLLNLKLNAKDFGQRDEVVPAATASAETIFIQFADGTTWGDSEFARTALLQRKHISEQLRRLDQILADKGEQTLLSTLLSDRDSVPLCILSLIDKCPGASSSCVAAGLRSVVETAKQRELAMQPPSPKAE